MTDKTIKLGGSYPFAGPASAYGDDRRRAPRRYFDCVNAKGGVNGRKIEFTTLDDGYEPAARGAERAPAGRAGQGVRAVQHARHARTTWRSGTTSTSRRCPQLFVATGASEWGADIESHP